MKGVRADLFWENLRPVLGKLVSSTFDKKRMIPYTSFSVFTKLSSIVLFILMKTVKLVLFLTI